MFGEKCSKQGHGPYALSAFLGHTSKKSFKRKLISVPFVETRQRLLTLCNHDNARNEIAKSKKKLFLLFLVLMNSQRINVLA